MAQRRRADEYKESLGQHYGWMRPIQSMGMLDQQSPTESPLPQQGQMPTMGNTGTGQQEFSPEEVNQFKQQLRQRPY